MIQSAHGADSSGPSWAAWRPRDAEVHRAAPEAEVAPAAHKRALLAGKVYEEGKKRA
jgi:hypothetical protein